MRFFHWKSMSSFHIYIHSTCFYQRRCSAGGARTSTTGWRSGRTRSGWSSRSSSWGWPAASSASTCPTLWCGACTSLSHSDPPPGPTRTSSTGCCSSRAPSSTSTTPASSSCTASPAPTTAARSTRYCSSTSARITMIRGTRRRRVGRQADRLLGCPCEITDCGADSIGLTDG